MKRNLVLRLHGVQSDTTYELLAEFSTWKSKLIQPTWLENECLGSGGRWDLQIIVATLILKCHIIGKKLIFEIGTSRIFKSYNLYSRFVDQKKIEAIKLFIGHIEKKICVIVGSSWTIENFYFLPKFHRKSPYSNNIQTFG